MNTKNSTTTLRQLIYFVTTADCGSVKGAALRLGVTQPSVSSALVKLEGILGVQLFLRHHAKGVALTQMGHELLPQARELVNRFAAFEEQARSLSSEPIGTIALGCYPSLAPLFLPALIERISAEFPGITLNVIVGTEDKFLPQIETGKVDLAICYGDCLPQHMFRLILRTARPHAIVSGSHPLAECSEVSLGELAHQPFILLDTMPGRRYFPSVFQALIAHTSESYEVVRGLVGRGVGYSMLVTRPDTLRSYEGREIVSLPIVEDTPIALICLARMPTSRTTRAVEILQKLCLEIAKGLRLPGDRPSRG